ncbi:MAG TPA: peptidyl-prolyl cis-trans isomerase [Anaeromyxobacter sp.]|nr:peptidyl-prolyl cis-trans isomerase [Anaeromyxobacter sp.]
MLRRLAFIGLALLAVTACQSKGPKKSGPVVARGNGFTITADEFKAKLDEQSPFIRARYTTLDRKKEFLDNLLRFEVLAREAEKEGLANDPDVQSTLKKVMVQKLVQKNFQDLSGASQIPDAELQKYYDDHKAEYFRPKKIRVSAVIWKAPAGTPEHAKKLAAARKALAKLQAEEKKKNTMAFAQLVNEFSEDPVSKSAVGDLNFKTAEELEKEHGKAVATAALALKPGETSNVVDGDQGIYLLRATGVQDELNRPFDQVKTQIANRLFREKKTKEFDEWLKKLKDQAGISVDDKALEAVEVSAPPASPPGMPGGMGHGGMGGGMMGGGMSAPPGMPPSGMPPPAPAPAPAAK